MQNHDEQQKERIRELETKVQTLQTRIEDSRAERERTLAPYRERFPELFKGDSPPDISFPTESDGPKDTWTSEQGEQMLEAIAASLRRLNENPPESEPNAWLPAVRFKGQILSLVIRHLDEERTPYIYERQDAASRRVAEEMEENPDADRDQVERMHFRRYVEEIELDRVSLRDETADFLRQVADQIEADDPWGTQWDALMEDPQAIVRRQEVHEEARQDRSDGE